MFLTLRLNLALIGPSWRCNGGRLFVFRDSPLWVVQHVAAWKKPDENTMELVRQAREELALRNGIPGMYVRPWHDAEIEAGRPWCRPGGP